MTHESPSASKTIDATPNTYGSAPEEWKSFYRTFEDLRRNVLTKIFALDQEQQDKLLKKMYAKQDESFSSVDDPGKYLTYHKSIGSSVGPVSAPNLDFEGDHSLMKFYEKLDKEIG